MTKNKRTYNQYSIYRVVQFWIWISLVLVKGQLVNLAANITPADITKTDLGTYTTSDIAALFDYSYSYLSSILKNKDDVLTIDLGSSHYVRSIFMFIWQNWWENSSACENVGCVPPFSDYTSTCGGLCNSITQCYDQCEDYYSDYYKT